MPEDRFLSEEYLVRLSRGGLPHDIDKINNLRALFVDLGAKDLQADVYLVCRIVRVGKMLPEDKDKKGANTFRRPFGCAVMSVSEVLAGKVSKEEEDKEHLIPIYTCGEDDAHQLHTDIIRKSKGPELVSKAKGIYVSMKLLNGELEQLKKESMLRNVTMCSKLGFADVIYPGDVRNDFYVTVGTGNFQQGHKTTAKNVECCVSVVLENGEVLPDCISLGSGEKLVSEVQSVIYYHSNQPRWNETFRINVSPDRFFKAHLRFYFRHLSSGESRDKNEKNFSFTFLPLISADGTTIKDDRHNLAIYKYDKKIDDPRIYLKEAASNNPKSALERNPKESFTVRTLLCSTKLTQNANLLSLLRWNSGLSDLEGTLKRITYIEPDEIVKFMQDIFDALFNILAKDQNRYGSLVFDALVFILGILTDKKYTNFRPVLDRYIAEFFSMATAYGSLLDTLRKYLVNCEDHSLSQQVRSTMKALEFLVKFIIRSRELYADTQMMVGGVTDVRGGEDFKVAMFAMLKDFNSVMARKSPTVIGTQTAALQNFGPMYRSLSPVFTSSELGKVVGQFIDAVVYDPSDRSKAKLQQTKLQLMLQVVEDDLFLNREFRGAFLPSFVQQLKTHMKDGDELGTVLEIIAEVLRTVNTTNKADIASVLHLLRPLTQNCMAVSGGNALSGQLASALIGCLHIVHTSGEFEGYVAGLPQDELADYLNESFVVFHLLSTVEVYPRDWLMMGLRQSVVIFQVLGALTPSLKERFAEGKSFKYQLWADFFRVCVSFLVQPPLQLEQFDETKRLLILNRHGDMRVGMGHTIKNMWEILGSNKIKFIPSLVGPLLEITLVPQLELRRTTLPIFVDIFECEFAATGSFGQVENETIDKLDIFVGAGKGDDEYRMMFGDILERKFLENPQLATSGVAFVRTVKSLLELLQQMRVLGEKEEYKDERSAVLLKLMRFFKESNREDMYYKYVERLCELHVRCGNFTEAAFCLQLHAEHLNWSNEKLRGYGKYPSQAHRQRKELIYTDIINYFDKGKAWENAITLCKELAEQYESELFDYAKMSQILQREARFFENIVSVPRYYSEYFRVGYYGKGFPASIRNKEFIFRGEELERIANFCERVQSQYPDAQILKTNTAPDDTVLNSEKQHIQIVKVDPVRTKERFKGRKVPEVIEKYFDVNDINTFTFARPFRKGAKSGNEFADLWTEKTFLVTEDSLPGILRRAEVLKTERVEISPIENACDAMVSKNRELISFINKYESMTGSFNVNPLTMAFNGVIDAAVNGGTEMYKKAFFVKSYLQQYPHHADFARQLKEAMDQQMQILEQGLVLHNKLVPDEMRALHTKMETFFADMKEKYHRPADGEDGKATTSTAAPSPAANALRDDVAEPGSPSSMRGSMAGEEARPSRPLRPSIKPKALKLLGEDAGNS
eukprot:Opistho-2@15256